VSIQDPIADMFTRIRNAQNAFKLSVVMPFSKMKLAILQVLKAEGYILDYKKEEEKGSKAVLEVKLKYFSGHPVIDTIKRVSKSARRVYRPIKEITPVIGGLGILIISTSKGIVTDKTARQLGVGGEIICEVS
jgi:small subunit ribosomal protein S8